VAHGVIYTMIPQNNVGGNESDTGAFLFMKIRIYAI
jgi:hypothetical protein